MTGWEKYGNNRNEIAKIVCTRTPVQIKKHAQCHSHQKHHESLSLEEKAQGKWTEDEHKAFLTGFEQCGNN
jgi:hypothetical protein